MYIWKENLQKEREIVGMKGKGFQLSKWLFPFLIYKIKIILRWVFTVLALGDWIGLRVRE